MAGDAFFAKTNKRKRSAPTRNGPVKRPRQPTGKFGAAKVSRQTSAPSRKRDEELDSQHTDSDHDIGGDIDDLDLQESEIDENASGEEDENETAAQKRLRLAKLYLKSVRDDLGDGEVDAAELDRDLIASRLRQDVLQHAGKIHLFIADSLPSNSTNPPSIRLKGHRLSITAAVASESGQTLFTSGKEGAIIKWDLLTGKRLATFPKIRPSTKIDRKGKAKMTAEAYAANEIQGHTDEVLALALSSDGKLLASGGKDRRIGVWDAEKNTWIRSFGGHRDTISALVFRKGSKTLYTASFDRTLKSFDLGAMGYVETLFGHQDPVTALDSLRGETAISAGGQDRTVRYWKIVDETQLVFRGGGRSKLRELLESGGIDDNQEDEGGDDDKGKKDKRRQEGFIEGRIDCVAMLDETTFVSGGDSGSISLWSTTKKKPLYTYSTAHGIMDYHPDPDAASTFASSFGANTFVRNPRWITSIAALPYSDVFASGSWDGQVRLWRLDLNKTNLPKTSSQPSSAQIRSFSPFRTIAVPGVINSLQLIRPPPGSVSSASWLSSAHSGNATKAAVDSTKGQDLLLIAGVGQEPRLGRWLQLTGKDGAGAKNATHVFMLSRTVSAVVSSSGLPDGEDTDMEG